MDKELDREQLMMLSKALKDDGFEVEFYLKAVFENQKHIINLLQRQVDLMELDRL